MILAEYSDTSVLSETKSRSQAGAHIFLSEDDQIPRFNGTSSLSWPPPQRPKLAALFLTTREIVPLHQTLIVMGWPQPKNPTQINNSTAMGICNDTIIAKSHQDDGHAIKLAQIPRISSSIPVLLGQRLQQLGQQ